MGWKRVGRDGTRQSWFPPLAAICQHQGSGEGREGRPAHVEGLRGWRCPRPGGPRGSRPGGGGRVSRGRSGVTRGQIRLRGRGSGDRAERMNRRPGAGPRGCTGARGSGAGGQEQPQPLPGAGGGAEMPPGSAEGVGRAALHEAGREASLPAPGRGSSPGLFRSSRAALAHLAAPRHARSPRGRARSLPPAAGPPARPFPAPRRARAHPGLSLGPARCFGRALASRGAPRPLEPPAPRLDAGEEAGLGRWADADEERWFTAQRMLLCSTSQKHLLKESKKLAEYFRFCFLVF